MDTFELLPSLAQGELSETSAPELVAAVFRSRASGTLWIETAEGVELRIYFRAGDMCGAAPFEGFHTLAHVLLANDWVSALEIDSTRDEAVATQKRHGEVLVAKGLLSPEQLRAALQAQHSSNLATLFGLTTGKYDWRGWEPPPPFLRDVVDPAAGLIDALEDEKHAPRRKKVLDWLGQVPTRLSLDWPELQARLTLQPLERRAAAILTLPRKLDEFVQASRLPQARAEALLAALLLVGAAEPQPQAQAPRVETPAPQPRISTPAPQPRLTPVPQPRAMTAEPPRVTPSPQPRVATPSPQPRVTPTSQPKAQPKASQPQPKAASARISEADLLDLVLEPLPDEAARADLLKPLPPHADAQELLAPLPMQASERPEPELDAPPDLLPPLELETRSSKSARLSRADREDDAMARLDALLLDEPPAPPAAPDEPPLEIDHSRKNAVPGVHYEQQQHGADESSARDLRKKMTARGIRNMGGPPAMTQGTVLDLDDEPTQPSPPPQIAKTKMTEEERIFTEEAQERLRRAPMQNAYTRLSISQNATQETIKAAYLTAAKRFHPDRASGGLAPMQGDLQQLFNLLKEAYENISTKEGRGTYDQGQRAGLTPGGGTPRLSTRKEEAAVAVKMGEVLLKKRDFEAAIAKLRRAIDLDVTGDALAALAWALVADPKATPATKEEAATLINRALRASGVTARTFYVAGVLWRTKDPDSAVDAFRKALEMDPHHSDAALELRLIEQRRGKQQKAGGGVLSGLLFGKRKG